MIFRSYLLFHLFELVLSRILLYIVKIVFKAEKKRVLFVNEDDTLTTRTSEGKRTDKKIYGSHLQFHYNFRKNKIPL